MAEKELAILMWVGCFFFGFDEHIYNFFFKICRILSYCTEKQINCLYIDKYITRTHKKKEKKRKIEINALDSWCKTVCLIVHIHDVMYAYKVCIIYIEITKCIVDTVLCILCRLSEHLTSQLGIIIYL